MAKIAILHPSDPAGHVPSGIDGIIRGILQWAPPDLEYTLLGATTDQRARPVGSEAVLPLGNRNVRFLPLVIMDAKARHSAVPLVVRYMWALSRHARGNNLAAFNILDFHRIEPVWLFRRDDRPKNMIVHQDMSVLRDKNCDIMWRHAPWLYERIESSLFRHVDHIFAVRQTAVSRYRNLYPDLANRFSFIPTWVDTSVFSAPKNFDERARARANLRSALGIGKTANRILVYVGRLDKQKDPLLLLRAFCEAVRQQDDLHLVVIGDGDLRQQVEAARKELVIENRVSLLGVKRPSEIVQVLHGSNLFVLSSAYEGMPIAVLEALATGLPVASTNVGEVPLVVRNGVSGQISAERSAGALATAICTALGQSESMTGEPCETSVASYRPEKVLSLLYENHRRQAKVLEGQAKLCVLS
jgi:glycosyltransferase involved in cell wall biosynthesis